MNYFLDTNAVIALLKNQPAACVAGRGVSYRGVLRLRFPRSYCTSCGMT